MLNLLFPVRCIGCRKTGKYLCSDCLPTLQTRPPLCPICHQPAISGLTHPRCEGKYKLNGLVSVFRYGGLMQQTIKKLKFRLITDLAAELADATYQKLSEWDTATMLWQRKRFVVIPLPLHPKRERWRGFNQAAIMGKILARKLNLDSQSGWIKRVHDTASQAEMKIRLTQIEEQPLAGLDPFAQAQKKLKLLKEKQHQLRADNVAGAFQIITNPTAKNILLIDDVWTTGATMNECAKVLKHSGASQVWGLTLAR